MGQVPLTQGPGEDAVAVGLGALERAVGEADPGRAGHIRPAPAAYTKNKLPTEIYLC